VVPAATRAPSTGTDQQSEQLTGNRRNKSRPPSPTPDPSKYVSLGSAMVPGANATWMARWIPRDRLRQPVEGVVRHAIAAHVSDCAPARNEARLTSVAAMTAITTIQRNRAVFLITMRFGSGSIVAACLSHECRHLLVEIVENGREQDLALGWCRQRRIAIAAGAAVIRRIRVRRRQAAGHFVLQRGAGLGARDIDQLRRQRSIKEVSSFVAWLP